MDKKTQKYKSGETISVTQIDFNHPVEFDFYKSHLYQKLRRLLVIFYYRNRALQSKFHDIYHRCHLTSHTTLPYIDLNFLLQSNI